MSFCIYRSTRVNEWKQCVIENAYHHCRMFDLNTCGITNGVWGERGCMTLVGISMKFHNTKLQWKIIRLTDKGGLLVRLHLTI